MTLFALLTRFLLLSMPLLIAIMCLGGEGGSMLCASVVVGMLQRDIERVIWLYSGVVLMPSVLLVLVTAFVVKLLACRER